MSPINTINISDYNKIAAKNTASTNSSKSTSSADFSNLLANAVSGMQTTGSNTLDDIFQRAATKYNVPIRLLKAVAKAESGYDADAVSSCGAQGIMQLMPSTAKSLGVQNPLDAEQNITGGAKYLSQLLTKYNGNQTLALAAYNAGSGNVAKYGGVPPFKETQAYIAKVLQYAGEPTSDIVNNNLSSNAVNNVSTSTNTNDDYLNYLQLMLAMMQTSSSNISSIGDTSDTLSSSSISNSTSTSNNYLNLIQSMLAQMSSSDSSDSSSISGTSGTSNSTDAENSYLNLVQSTLAQMGSSDDSSNTSSSSSTNSPMYGLL